MYCSEAHFVYFQNKYVFIFLLSFLTLAFFSGIKPATPEMLSASLSQSRILQTCSMPHPNVVNSVSTLQSKYFSVFGDFFSLFLYFLSLSSSVVIVCEVNKVFLWV